MLSLLLFNTLVVAVQTVFLQRFSHVTVILAELVHPKRPPTSMGPEPSMDYVRCAVRGIVYADDTVEVCRGGSLRLWKSP